MIRKTMINKDRLSLSQIELLDDYLHNNTTSAKEASVDTGLPIEAICWYKRKLRQLGQIAVVNYARCRITGRKVQQLTTNPAQFPKDTQLPLWPLCS